MTMEMSPVASEPDKGSIAFHSEWGSPVDESLPDPERHSAFVQYVRSVADGVMPWLLPLLEALNARVIVGVRLFQFELPLEPGKWYPIADVEDRLQMVPWRDVDEPMQ